MDDSRFPPTSVPPSSSDSPSSMHPGQTAIFSPPSSLQLPFNTTATVTPTSRPYTSHPGSQTSIYAQASAPASAPELALHRPSWSSQEQEQYPLHRHSLSLDMDMKASPYSPAPSSALSVTSTSFSYSPFASPVEPRMGMKSYFGNAQYEPSQNDMDDRKSRGSDAFLFPVPSSHEGIPRWFGTSPGSVMTIGPESETGRGAEAFSQSHPGLTDTPRGVVTAGNFTTKSVSGFYKQISEKTGNVASDVNTGAEDDQRASRPLTFPRVGMQASYPFPEPTLMAQNWPSQAQPHSANPGPEGHPATVTGPGNVQGVTHAPNTESARKIFYPTSMGGAFNFTAQGRSLGASLGADQHFEYDAGELSDDPDADEFDDPFDVDFDLACSEGRLAGHCGGADAFASSSSLTHSGTRTSPGSATFRGSGHGAAIDLGSSNAVSSLALGQGHLGFPPRTRSPAPELQFPPGISGTPADFNRGFFDQSATQSSFLYDWKKTRKLSDPGNIDAPKSKAGFIGLERPSSSEAQLPHELDLTLDRPSTTKRNHIESSSLGPGSQAVKVLVESTKPGEPPKKVKMHQCGVCSKLFPRPSGLATHMNSHSGARPFKCPLALCPKTFAVRSNARRHLRTHGITIPPPSLRGGRAQDESFHVGFETPVIVDVHDPLSFLDSGDQMADDQDAGGSTAKREDAKTRTTKLRWVPQSLADRSNAAQLRSISPTSDMTDVDANLGPLQCAQTSSAIPTDESSSVHSTHHGMHRIDAPFPSYMLDQLPNNYSVRTAPDRAGMRIAPAPLPPAIPTDESRASDLHARFEERNSYSEAGTQPYHPDQVSL